MAALAKRAVIVLSATVVAGAVSALEDMGPGGSGVSPPPPAAGKDTEIVEYSGVNRDGELYDMGRTVTTYVGGRTNFEAEVKESREKRETIHTHKTSKRVREEYPDRPAEERVVHPGDEAARREREKKRERREAPRKRRDG